MKFIVALLAFGYAVSSGAGLQVIQPSLSEQSVSDTNHNSNIGVVTSTIAQAVQNPDVSNPLNAEVTLYVNYVKKDPSAGFNNNKHWSEEAVKDLDEAGIRYTLKDVNEGNNSTDMDTELLNYFDGDQSEVDEFKQNSFRGNYPLAIWHTSAGEKRVSYWSQVGESLARSFTQYRAIEGDIEQFVSQAAIMGQDPWLNAHNTRRQAVDSPNLTWDSELATYATEWAKTLASEATECDDIYHRTDVGMNTKNAGENINCFPLIGPDRSVFPPEVGVLFQHPADTISAYVNSEGPGGSGDSIWNPATQGCSDGGTGCFHYTQIVDQRSSKLGCGYAMFSDNNFVITVCNFDPPGNATESGTNRLPNLYPGLTQTEG